ncbi:MAG TPA: OmpH family outer membrane protein [Flavisolibacter sp.]
MKASLIINGVLLVLVGVLFYLHFSSRREPVKTGRKAEVASTSAGGEFRIAYFELDSVETNFTLLKEIKNELTQQDEENSRTKMRLKQKYQNKLNELQKQEMSQVQSELAARELQKLEMDIRGQMQTMDQKLQDLSIRRQTEAKTKIEDFLKEYNKSRGFSYIFAYEPGFMFYRDTMYNITGDLIEGLNKLYPSKK